MNIAKTIIDVRTPGEFMGGNVAGSINIPLLEIEKRIEEMINTIKKLFGFGPQVDFRELLKNGAMIIDVRTKSEYESGHINGSINIPLNNLSANFSKIKRDKPVITCCASGMRSASAKSILKSNGFKEVYNGGGWTGLRNKMR